MEYNASKARYDNMKYNKCGESGLKLPAVSLGLWHNFGANDNYENMREMCFCAFDNGVTHFDIANNYGHPANGSAEENFGKILREDMSAYRDEMIISTKAGYHMFDGPYGDFGSRKYLLSSLDASLRRLGIDYVDIFYHHRPDPDTPLEETMGALYQAVKSGKALYAGLSNYDGETMARAAAILRDMRCPFVINQNRYSILDRNVEENGLLDSARNERKGVIVFSPLAQGLLTDRYIDGIPSDSRVRTSGIFLKEMNITEETLYKIRALNAIACDRGESLAQMALAWVLRREEVTSVLVGASKPSQILDNLCAINSVPFTEEELLAIDEIALILLEKIINTAMQLIGNVCLTPYPKERIYILSVLIKITDLNFLMMLLTHS